MIFDNLHLLFFKKKISLSLLLYVTKKGTMEMSHHQFCLKWNNHSSNLLKVFGRLFSNESFTDVTLAAEGRSIRAHKVKRVKQQLQYYFSLLVAVFFFFFYFSFLSPPLLLFLNRKRKISIILYTVFLFFYFFFCSFLSPFYLLLLPPWSSALLPNPLLAENR